MRWADHGFSHNIPVKTMSWTSLEFVVIKRCSKHANALPQSEAFS